MCVSFPKDVSKHDQLERIIAEGSFILVLHPLIPLTTVGALQILT